MAMTTSASPSTESAASVDDTPTTMKAVVQGRYGAPQEVLKLARIERPAPGADEVLVRVRATSVNTPDLVAVTGMPRILRLKTGLLRPGTAIRGTDVAGVIEAVGRNVTHVERGDEVFGSVWDNEPVQEAGTFAQFAVVPSAQVVRKPAGVSFEEAAAAVMAGVTALNAIRDVGNVTRGTRVLVNGASGGVGTMAVQIATVLGAEVTGVCSHRNAELVSSLGADHVIDYTESDYTQGSERYDVVLDNVMNHPPAATARVLAAGGMFIPNSVGTSGGFFGGLPRMARASLLGRRGAVRLGTATCVVNRDNLAALATLLQSRDVRVSIDRTYPLDNAAEAVAHMLSHHARGKVAIGV
jgi:NADPH:quinone reductase-like Zn-dependent oxidoreductase